MTFHSYSRVVNNSQLGVRNGLCTKKRLRAVWRNEAHIYRPLTVCHSLVIATVEREFSWALKLQSMVHDGYKSVRTGFL